MAQQWILDRTAAVWAPQTPHPFPLAPPAIARRMGPSCRLSLRDSSRSPSPGAGGAHGRCPVDRSIPARPLPRVRGGLSVPSPGGGGGGGHIPMLTLGTAMCLRASLKQRVAGNGETHWYCWLQLSCLRGALVGGWLCGFFFSPLLFFLNSIPNLFQIKNKRCCISVCQSL